MTETLTVSSGTFTSASDYNDVAISSGATLTLSGDITVSGDFDCQGTFNADGNKVSFDKDAKQTLSGTLTLGNAYISNELEVPSGSNLTFSAGSTVTFKTGDDFDYSDNVVNGGFLNVKGKFTAIGTSDSRITFTREGSTGYWGSVVLNDADDASHINYCDFEYGQEIVNLFGGSDNAQGMTTFRSCDATVENCSFSNYTCKAVDVRDSSSNILNNTIDGSGAAVDGIICEAQSAPYIYGNIISNIDVYGDGNGVCTKYSSPKIVNNTFFNCKVSVYITEDDNSNPSTNVQVIGNLIRDCGLGVWIQSQSTAIIYNNTISKINTGVYANNAEATLRNNIIWEAYTTAVIGLSGSVLTVTYSCIEGGYSGDGNFQQDPLFTNSGNNDYTLQATSPCINTGTPDTTGMNLPSVDLAGNPRISSGRIDMGAYEALPSTPTVTTQAATDVSYTSATGNGNITDLGESNPTAHGVCWSTSANPTVDGDHTDEGGTDSTGAFTSSMTGLNADTEYHYRAYATNAIGIAYGADRSFTTQANSAPTVTTQAASDIDTNSATGNGNITDLGTSNPTAYGVCWSTSANPTVDLQTKTDKGATSSTGAFTSTMNGLTAGVTYHYRAYATNEVDTSYGEDRTFTTELPPPPPTFLVSFNLDGKGTRTGGGALSQVVVFGGSASAPTVQGNGQWAFSGWDKGFTNIQSNLTVTAQYTTKILTLTYSAGAGGTLSGTTSQSVEYGQSGSAVTAVPDSVHEFDQWSDGSTENPRTDTNVSANISVTAQFKLKTYTLTYSAGAHGSISGTNPQTVEYGQSGSAVTAVPDTGYEFEQWSDGSTDNPRTDTDISGDMSFTAQFAPKTYTLTYSAGAGGSITGANPQSVKFGESGSAVTAVPDTGYAFDKWSDGSTANPRTDTNISGDMTIEAEFKVKTITLVYTPSTGGTLTGSLIQEVEYGSSGSAVTAVPDKDYEFDKWSDGSTANPRTDADVTANINVTAEFAKVQYLLEVTDGTGSGGYAEGDVVNISANPAPEDKLFDEWIGDTSTIANVSLANTTLVMPKGNISIAATYKDKPVEKIALAVTGGTGSGEYEAGATVRIAADPAPEGMVFDKWTGNVATVTNVNLANTSVTIPESDISLAATYKDKPVEKFTISVGSGTGSGEYEAGSTVNIAANPAPEDEVFDKWIGDTSTVANINLANTVATMPENNISIVATYKDKPIEKFTLSVSCGTGSGEYEAGAVISVSAIEAPEGKVFEQWSGQTSTLSNVANPNTSITMPDSDVSIAACFMDKPDEKFDLTVNSGTGSGSYMSGEVVSIAATPAPEGKVFVEWSGQTCGLANVNNPNTSVTMACSNVVVSAVYGDKPVATYPLEVQEGTGDGDYEAGRVVTIAATPAEDGYMFDKWVGQTANVANINIPNTIITMPEASVTVQATYKENPAQNFKLEIKTETWKMQPSEQVKESVLKTATVADVPAGQLLNLMAPEAPEGFVFDIWTGQTANVANVNLPKTTIYMPDADVVVVAAFKEVEEKSVLTVSGGSGSGEYDPNSVVTISAAEPVEGQMFDKWTGQTSNVENINLAETTIVMPSTDVSITAVYCDKPVVLYNLVVSNGTGTGLYAAAEMIDIIADDAPAGYEFSNWSGQIATVENIYSSSTKLYMPGNEAEIVAVYTEKAQTYTVTATAEQGGSVTPETITVEENSTASFTVTPDDGYMVNATVGGTATAGEWNGNVYTTGSITSDSTVIFSFVEQPALTHVVVANAGTGGSVTPSIMWVNDNETASFTVSPKTNYTTNSAVGGTAPAGTWNTARTVYTTGAVTSDCSVYFTFTYHDPGPTPTYYTVTFDLGDKGERVGGGTLTQQVKSGSGAEAPEVKAAEGWAFAGWDKDFSDVTSSMTVSAVYQAKMLVWDTEVTIVNPSASALQGTLKGSDGAGNIVWTKDVQLNAYGRACLDIRTQAGDLAYAIKSMIFDVDSQNGNAAGTARYYKQGNTMAAVPGVSRGFNSELIIPHVASTDFWWTGIGLTNYARMTGR